jgi:hypothetical protein
MPLPELEKHSPSDYLYDLRDQLKRHIFTRSDAAFAKADKTRDAIKTKSQLAARQKYIRQAFLKSMGHFPAKKSPLNPQITGTHQGDGFVVHNVIFESRPSHFVTSNLYIPDTSTTQKPGPAILYICGHSPIGRLDPGYQDIHIHLVKAGFIVLCQDTQGQGERYCYFDPATGKTTVNCGTMEHEYVGARTFLLDATLAGSFLYDAIRGIDYLTSRPEVDPSRVGATGESGGGTHTSMLMMAEPRLAAAAPALFPTSRHAYLWAAGAQDAEQIWPGFTSAGLDHEDFFIAMAPRPVHALAAQYDFFPIEGTRTTIQRAKRLYKLAGKGANLQLSDFPIPHSYPADMRNTMVGFFVKHLLKKKYTPPASVKTFTQEDLRCTKSGQLRADFPHPQFAHETNVARLAELEALRKKTKSKSEALAWLKKRIHAFRSPCPLNTRVVPTDTLDGFEVQSLLWWSQTNLFNHALVFRPLNSAKSLPVTLAVWDHGTTALAPHIPFIQSQNDVGRAVLVLNVSGTGAIAPIPINKRPLTGYSSTMHTFANDMIFLDDSICAMRAFDVTRALDVIATRPDLSANGTHLYAHGRHGVYGQLAAAIDPRIAKVHVQSGIGSFANLIRSFHYDRDDIQSLVIPGILAHLDLPDLLTPSPSGRGQG